MFAKIGTFIGGIALAIAGFLGVTPTQDTKIVEVPVQVPQHEVVTPQKQILSLNTGGTEETFGAFSPVSGGTYRIRTSLGSSDTSIQLSSLKEPVTGNAITMSTLNSDIGYGTLDPQSPTRKELISFTGVTQNSDGSATLTGVSRGLSFQYPFTASSTLRKSHPGQSTFILSDSPQLFNEYARKRSDETITGQWTFSTFPITPSTTPASATTTGISQIATGLQAASSTPFGSTGHRLVLSTLISTSTATSGNFIPVTRLDGKLDSGFISSAIGSTTVRVYTSSASSTNATATWSKPTDSSFKGILVEVVGGGGGGGGNTLDPTTVNSVGGGGGGGGYSRELLSASALSGTTSVFITVGAGGAPALSYGGIGSTTSFGNFVFATGGDGGVTRSSGTTGLGGTAGCGYQGDLNTCGQDGITGGNAGGTGGSSYFGGGGAASVQTGVNGTTGKNYGGGGGAGMTASGQTTDGGGGNGANGVVIITEYY